MRTNPALRASDRSYDELVCGQPDGFAAYVDIFPLLVNILYWPTYFTFCNIIRIYNNYKISHVKISK